MLYVHRRFVGTLFSGLAMLRGRGVTKPKQLSRAVYDLGMGSVSSSVLLLNHCRLGARSVENYNFVLGLHSPKTHC